MKKLLFIILPALFLVACRPQQPQKVMLQGSAQGTYYSITYYDTLGRQLGPQLDSLLDAFDASVSTYQPQSVISRINSNDPDVEVDEIFRKVFLCSQQISELTHGAFDVTVGPVTNAWGFGFTAAAQVDSSMIDSLLTFVGYRNVSLQGDKLVKQDPRSSINFNAIAQGYSVDVVCDWLASLGITNYLVDIGGEVRARGQKPGGMSWRVGVEKPAADKGAARELEAVVELHDMALATSGNYRKYYEKDGVRYSHTINPKTGYPVTHGMLSASVLASDAMTADALATSCMVIGPQQAMELIKRLPNTEAYFILNDTTGALHTWYTPGFKKIIAE